MQGVNALRLRDWRAGLVGEHRKDCWVLFPFDVLLGFGQATA